MFSAPVIPRTIINIGLRNMLMDIMMLYADRITMKIPAANMPKDKILPTVCATLNTSRASVPVVSLNIGFFLGMKSGARTEISLSFLLFLANLFHIQYYFFNLVNPVYVQKPQCLAALQLL